MRESPRPKGWHEGAAASGWVARFAPLVPAGGSVLDLACGAGRHSRLFLELGHPVVAVDRDLRGIQDLSGHPGMEAHETDLEDGGPFPFPDRRFAAVVVANYLYRPLLTCLVEAVDYGGLLLYETFARGNERLGSPGNPDFLLERGELLDVARPQLEVLAYEDLEVDVPKPAVVQRIAARRPGRLDPLGAHPISQTLH